MHDGHNTNFTRTFMRHAHARHLTIIPLGCNDTRLWSCATTSTQAIRVKTATQNLRHAFSIHDVRKRFGLQRDMPILCVCMPARLQSIAPA